MKKAYSFRLSGDEEAEAVREFLKGRRAVPHTVTTEELVSPASGAVPPAINLPYNDYMAALPKGWEVSESTPGTKAVLDEHRRTRRIFKEGRDY